MPTGHPRPTVHRIVAALAAEGMLAEVPRGGAFGLGPRLMALAARAWDRFELRLIAATELAKLRDATGETVHLAVRSGHEMIYVDKLESPQAVRMASRIGTRVKLHSSSVGKAWLAALPPDEAAALLPQLDLAAMTPQTLTTVAALAAEIERIRARGYSDRRGGERSRHLVLWRRHHRCGRGDRLHQCQHPEIPRRDR